MRAAPITERKVIGMSDKLYGVLIHPDTTIELVETPGGADEIHRLVG